MNLRGDFVTEHLNFSQGNPYLIFQPLKNPAPEFKIQSRIKMFKMLISLRLQT